MKKVLIISNLFHSSPRICAIAKYLFEFGWESTVLTIPINKDSFYCLWCPPSGFEKK